MRVVLSAIIFVVIGTGIYLLVVKMPLIRMYQDCYNTAYQVVNEKGIITRMAWTTEQEVCIVRKQILLKATACFKSTDAVTQTSATEKVILKSAAERFAAGTETIDQLIAEHNKRCMYPNTVLQYDSHTNTWF
jgi:hypothetical protein